MDTIRVGLIGYGYASKTFHAPLMAGVPGLALAAVSSSDPGKVRADWPDLPVESSAQALVDRPDVQLVVIATPNDTHFPLARAALLAGKHVVVDKPFTVTLQEARDLDELAQRQGRLLSVFHNRRWDSDFLTLKALLASGELGRVVHFESHFDRWRPQVRDRWREQAGRGGGLWNDLGPHLLDQALQLFGMPEGLSVDLASQRDGSQADDYFHARLRYASPHGGLQVILHASALVAAVGPRYVVHGTRGSYLKRGLDPQEDQLKAGARPRLEPLGDWGRDPQDGVLTLGEAEPAASRRHPTLPGNYLGYYAAVRDAVRGAAPNPVPAGEAMQVMALIEAGRRSAARRCEMPVNGH
ncbi:oxidoreductase [Eleftheria terrae]|uniref:oxidoreductase n=1 Tax=Eleftheria terrae TaxID=1597781 RepID=UPI00263B1A7E|nr:oxidoreductase [Eleftheria terrae]WKB54044.1 oxidoreductase [Eleftheria terrae]